MFRTLDHLNGAITVRIRRILFNLAKKSDISFITPNIGIGGVCNLEILFHGNVHAILDLRSEKGDNLIQIQKFSIDYMRIKIPDRGIPDEKDIVSAIKWIQNKIREDKKIFIHCNLGRGRAPMIACLYLISQGNDPYETIAYVKKLRKYTYFNNRQLNYIIKFGNNKF